tara:strand:- start:165 stop:302 length:138 start_codon:yes stop_codon:yes gene_type:complete
MREYIKKVKIGVLAILFVPFIMRRNSKNKEKYRKAFEAMIKDTEK